MRVRRNNNVSGPANLSTALQNVNVEIANAGRADKMRVIFKSVRFHMPFSMHRRKYGKVPGSRAVRSAWKWSNNSKSRIRLRLFDLVQRGDRLRSPR